MFPLFEHRLLASFYYHREEATSIHYSLFEVLSFCFPYSNTDIRHLQGKDIKENYFSHEKCQFCYRSFLLQKKVCIRFIFANRIKKDTPFPRIVFLFFPTFFGFFSPNAKCSLFFLFFFFVFSFLEFNQYTEFNNNETHYSPDSTQDLQRTK